MKATHLSTAAVALTLFAAGCANEGPATAPPARQASAYLLSAEPKDARNVKQARAAADGEALAVVGRIGGDEKPWVEGKAAFLITDVALVPCSEKPGDNCPTPWDYCCDLDVLKDSRVMVKFVDAQGKVLDGDAKQLFGVKELQTVVVRGKATRDAGGNVTLLADGLFKRS